MICFNGSLVAGNEAVILPNNRSFRYGDSLFETMRMQEGELLLNGYHFERLFHGLEMLQIDTGSLDEEMLVNYARELAKVNNCLSSAKVRLAVYREENGCGFLLEAAPLEKNSEDAAPGGCRIDIHPSVRKASDPFAELKSANFLPYVMADLYCQAKNLHECLVLNAFGNICDGSKTNVFIIKNGGVSTPGLSQGCVAGVMRRHVIDRLQQGGRTVNETGVSPDDLQHADAVFLTNAIRGIRPVEFFRDRRYSLDEVTALQKVVQG
jgi:branched-chain amino acid aminotransferase